MTPLARRALRAWPVVATLLAGWLLWIGYWRFLSVVSIRPYDGELGWYGARAILKGLDPYSAAGLKVAGRDASSGLGYPPTTVAWFLPLARLEIMEMKAVWTTFTLACLLVQSWLTVRELRFPAPLPSLALLLGAVLSSYWMKDHLYLAQFGGPIACFYALAWVDLRRGRDARAGVWLGLACTLKFYPGVMVLFLLLTRRYRGFLAACGVWLAVAAPITLWIGGQSWTEFAAQAKPYTVYWMSHVKNGSLQGLVARLHYWICEFPAGQREVWAPGSYAASALGVALCAGAFLLSRRHARRDASVDLPFAIFTLLSTFTNPYVWEHYNVTLITPIAVAFVALIAARRAGLSGAATIAGLLTIAAVLAILTQDTNTKNLLWDGWFGRAGRLPHTPWIHFQLHFYEACNWLPGPMIAALCALLLGWSKRRPGEHPARAGCFDRLALPDGGASLTPPSAPGSD